MNKLNKELKKMGIEAYLEEDLYFSDGYYKKKIKFKVPEDINCIAFSKTIDRFGESFESKFFKIYESSGWKLYDKKLGDLLHLEGFTYNSRKEFKWHSWKK